MLDVIYKYISLQGMIWLVVAMPLSGAAVNGLLSFATSRGATSKLKGFASFAGCVFPFISFLAAVIVYYTLTGLEGGEPAAITGPLFRWIAAPKFVVEVGLSADRLSLIMSLAITGIGFLVHLYSLGFMSHEEGRARYYALMNLFLFFALLAVLAENLILMFAGWEGLTLCTFLLCNYWFEKEANAAAGARTMVINAIGDAGFLAAIFLIFSVMSAAGLGGDSQMYGFQTMSRYNGYFVPLATLISLLLFAGAVAKSAQIPLYIWLPESSSSPLPAAALINTVTIASIGVYMIARMNFIFALSPTALHVIAIVGTITAIYAAMLGLVATDLTRLLAYSTMSQFGFMYLAAGVGAFSVSMYHLVSHALFKALLFLSAGSVIMALGGCTDITQMGGLKKRMPLTSWTFVIAALALSGIIPTIGFFSMHQILWQAFERGNTVLWALSFLCQGITAFYIFRAAGLIFFGESNVPAEKMKRVVEAPFSMAVPMMALATAVAVGGIFGVPEVLGGKNQFVAWLSKLIPYEISHAPAEGGHTELILMVIGVIWSAHFAIMGWIVFAQRRGWAERIARKTAFAHTILVNRFYIDVVYEKAIAGPAVWFSKNIMGDLIDRTCLDGLVYGGAARCSDFFAGLSEGMASRSVGRYILYFLIGAVIVVAFMVL